MRSAMWSVPDGYTPTKPIQLRPHSVLQEAVRDADGSSVLLKAYLSNRSEQAEARVRREFEALRRVSGTGVPRALDLDCSTDPPVLVLERVPGLALDSLLAHGPLALETWLDLATAATEILASIHAARTLHKDLTPSNILFDPSSSRVWISDFGLAVEVGASQPASDPLGGTLAAALRYISPEQTGRMNRGCDARSDLYSLGATLYHALTGRPPFESDDPLELVHAHLARMPESPDALRSGLPTALSLMVLKLLTKEPQDRYQSARALHTDLLACRTHMAQTGDIPPDFALGAAEAPAAPRFGTKLHGRERESELLNRTFLEVAQGRPHTLWIQGSPGVGKSTLVDQLRPRIAQSNGYLIKGKFDLYGDRPYAGWISALSGLTQQLLIESNARLERWRIELRKTLGSMAPVLVELVPDLHLILGDMPPPPRLEAREAQARLSLALERFIAACATPDHPLVIFLDDLQSSDLASRALLQDLLANPPATLLVIGAYRPLGPDDSLHALFTRLSDAAQPIFIDLGPLSHDATIAMLAEALERHPSEVRAFAEIVERRTANLPALIRDFVDHIHGRELLRYQPRKGWVWDLAEIASTDIPDSAVALMSDKLDRLAPEARSLVDLASCVGDEFNIDLLSELTGQERSAISAAVDQIAEAGLILPCLSGFRFAHDRIRESAREHLSSDARARIHCGTARILLQHVPDPEHSARALEITEHLNRIPDLPEDLRVTALRLNYTVGHRSLAVGAAAAAASSFAIARQLFRAGCPEIPKSFILELYLQSAESAFQLGEFATALALLEEGPLDDLSPIDLARVEAKRIQILSMCRPAETCVRHALDVLSRLGVRWKMRPSRARSCLALWRVRRMLRRAGPELFQPATSFHPEQIAPLLVIRSAGALLARVDVNLAALATCFSLRHHIEVGYWAPPGYAIAVYAMYLYLLLEDRAHALRCAEAALQWTERLPDLTAPRARMTVQVILYPFLMPRRQAFAEVDGIVASARENGDTEFVQYAQYTTTCSLALAGDPVRAISDRLARMGDLSRGSTTWSREIDRYRRIYGLLDGAELTLQEIGERYATDLQDQGVPTSGQSLCGPIWLMVLSTLGRHDLVFSHAELLSQLLFRVSPWSHVVDHAFYRGLAAAVLATTVRGRARSRYRRALRQSLRFVERRARDGPDFRHLEPLLGAEQARLALRSDQARNLYKEAANAAARQAFPHHSALAHERHASLLMALRRHTEAAAVLREAISGYRDWGASAKVRQLTRDHIELLT